MLHQNIRRIAVSNRIEVRGEGHEERTVGNILTQGSEVFHFLIDIAPFAALVGFRQNHMEHVLIRRVLPAALHEESPRIHTAGNHDKHGRLIVNRLRRNIEFRAAGHVLVDIAVIVIIAFDDLAVIVVIVNDHILSIRQGLCNHAGILFVVHHVVGRRFRQCAGATDCQNRRRKQSRMSLFHFAFLRCLICVVLYGVIYSAFTNMCKAGFFVSKLSTPFS